MNPESVIAMRYVLQRPSFRLDVDVAIPMHGITGVYGRSGSGKTSLLRCIAGLEVPESGRLVVAGDTWQDESNTRPVHRREIGYVFQEPRLFEHLDVLGNIEFGARRRNGNAADLAAVVDMLGLHQLLDRRPGALSGGESQRVAIARALRCAPRFVLMDEPLASLDSARKAEILPFLERLHAESSIPVIYVSHNIDEICRLCDHLLVIDEGRVVASGELQQVLLRTDLPMLAGEEAGAVIEGAVCAYDKQDQLLCLKIDAGEIWVPADARKPGSSLRIRVRANDVSLCRSRPGQSSILNILPAVVESIQEEQGASDLVRLAIGKDRLLARVTRRSIREIGVVPGGELFVQLKSVALRSPAAQQARPT